MVGDEMCDAGILPGCASTCKSVKENFECTNGSLIAPSVCKCMKGFKALGTECVNDCEDGLVVKGELCDDKGLGGCSKDCKEVTTNFTCSGGSPTGPSECKCKSGYVMKKNDKNVGNCTLDYSV
jgi:hypothetical protein